MKKTALYNQHLSLNGRIINFCNWALPVQYTSVIEEHLAVRNCAGIFDVSHMGQIEITGKDALTFLEYLTCNDNSNILPNQVKYNLIINESGGVVDDILIYFVKENNYFIVSNAVNHEKLLSYLINKKGNFKIEIKDIANDWEQLALQGPKAEIFLEHYFERSFNNISNFHFEDFVYKNNFFRISRTGYTGSGGFEIYSNPTGILEFFENILKINLDGLKVVPSGLGARDSLRLEVMFPLYGNELNENWTPIESGLSWTVKEKNKPFISYNKIINQKINGSESSIYGFKFKEKVFSKKFL